jgi:hypothetical protein
MAKVLVVLVSMSAGIAATAVPTNVTAISNAITNWCHSSTVDTVSVVQRAA